jgi:hypothetical protein
MLNRDNTLSNYLKLKSFRPKNLSGALTDALHT